MIDPSRDRPTHPELLNQPATTTIHSTPTHSYFHDWVGWACGSAWDSYFYTAFDMREGTSPDYEQVRPGVRGSGGFSLGCCVGVGGGYWGAPPT